MKKKTKALLFTLLAYPGSGHYLLGQYRRALCLIGCFSLALIYFIYAFYAKLSPMVEQVKLGKLALNGQAIASFMQQHNIVLDIHQMAGFTYCLLVIWLIAIFDIMRQSIEE